MRILVTLAVATLTGCLDETSLLVCGDGVKMLAEACDDGNTIDGDGCSRDCRSTETCGNAVIDLVMGEECDDGTSGLSNRGCSSRCKTELLSWLDVSPGPIGERMSHVMAYDAVRDRVVLFGGNDPDVYFNETWEWDGLQWRKMAPLVSPPAGFAAMTFDRARGVILLRDKDRDTWTWDGETWTKRELVTSPAIGGRMVFDTARGVAVFVGAQSAAPTSLAETWEWNGETWTQRTDVGAPPGGSFLIAYDEQRAVTVFYSGRLDGPTYPRQTWEYNGVQWTQLQAAPPSTLTDGALTYIEPSAGSGRVVLFGGYDGSPYTSNTWEWDGATWTLRAPASRPPARTSTASAYHASSRQIVLFGGYTGGVIGDTWLWDGTNWRAPAQPGVAPSPRFAPLVFDPNRARALMYGGFSIVAPAFLSDWWSWQDGAWTQLAATGASPGPRGQFGAAFDVARDRFVLFGGRPGGSTRLDDTWEWDGTSWLQRTSATSPSPRWDPAMVYDAARGVTVLFGGSDMSGPLGDTWIWDGTSWTQLSPASSPSPRWDGSTTYDPVRERVVLFGGAGGGMAHTDTWEWDGQTWHAITAEPGPPTNSSIAYDPQRQRTILVGGGSDDAWEYDGATWQKLSIASEAPPRTFPMTVYDPVRRELVVFGGLGLINYRSDTLVLRYETPLGADERCGFADEDLDGDGLAGCADPDCWARCAPRCPPGKSCDPLAPRCGDGQCSPIEDRYLCPSDCTK